MSGTIDAKALDELEAMRNALPEGVWSVPDDATNGLDEAAHCCAGSDGSHFVAFSVTTDRALQLARFAAALEQSFRPIIALARRGLELVLAPPLDTTAILAKYDEVRRHIDALGERALRAETEATTLRSERDRFADIATSQADLKREAQAFGQRHADALRELVAGLPECDRCNGPATRAHVRGGERYCDEHGTGDPAVPDVPEYPRAVPLRRAVALLEGRGDRQQGGAQ
ncbi:MAG: hypothetical protein MUF34_30750 [Polyangiaceae bacterium]|jgi:hypothetical protein|nr:hypothetical protein [Polyangiaceae bacterium]